VSELLAKLLVVKRQALPQVLILDEEVGQSILIYGSAVLFVTFRVQSRKVSIAKAAELVMSIRTDGL
jgi:hypothetical protein